jgi:hypothetical protein
MRAQRVVLLLLLPPWSCCCGTAAVQHTCHTANVKQLLLLLSHCRVCHNLFIFQADIESTFLEADKGYCTDIRDEYVRHFLGGEFVTGKR